MIVKPAFSAQGPGDSQVTKLAVLSDIHGNSLALGAVLADLDAQGGADYVVVLGDLAVFGPDPAGVLNLLWEREPVFYVRGNTDRYLVEGQYPGGPGSQSWESQVLASFPWTARQLGEAGLQFLASLPPQQLLRLDGDHTILAVHGSPRSDEEGIRRDTPDAELASMLSGRSYTLLLCAHTHLPLDRMVVGRRVVNVGSVGLPFDGDPGASYARVYLEPGGGYQVEFRRVTYDVEAVVSQLFVVDHPTANVGTYNLRTARPLGQKLVYTDRMRQGRVVADSSDLGANGRKKNHSISPVSASAPCPVVPQSQLSNRR
jgi:predicted phosphodiesterase